MRHGAEVFAVMSPKARKIISPQLMHWATGNEVTTELTGRIEHISLVGEHKLRADLVLVAPATANTISKIACGIDDTTVTSVVSTAFGSHCPIIIVPAMHASMYDHPIVLKNIKILSDLGVEFVGPRLEEEKAKIAQTEEILNAVIRKLFYENDFSGMNVLVTAGATLEHIDPIRVITNRSSGKMGIALADEACNRGANVTLVYGTGTETASPKVRVIRAQTTKQMLDAVTSELKSKKYDLAIAVAAVADWTPEKQYEKKISSHDTHLLNLKLKPTPKIIDCIKKVSPETFLVGFRAEYNLTQKKLIESGYKRLQEAKADLIVVNDTSKKGAGFETDTNEVFVVDGEKRSEHIPMEKKKEVARKILNIIIERMKKR
jgi:phosphopantothenoylcysteine decarboxylase/phosphopantothenate--cysteine ligase